MKLLVEARQSLGHFHLNAAIEADRGVTALFGKSGSGKTSLMRVIAGLSIPQRGRVVFDDTILLDTERGVLVPPHRRRFGYVFQEARLFPHLNVRQNLAYGRWFSPQAHNPQGFDRIVELLGIGALLDRPPSNLSGGERQRVAIGRALLASPRLLLMDEPLAALDEERKAEIIPYLERLRDEMEMPIVYVSHSVAEVGRLADQVVMMADGRVAATGRPSEVLKGSLLSAQDRRETGAVLAGVVRAIDPDHDLATVQAGGLSVLVPEAGLHEGQAVRLHIPERDVLVATTNPTGLSALNIFEGVIASIEDEESGAVRIGIASGEVQIFARITTFSRDRLGLAAGRPVYAIVKSVALAR